MRRRRRTVVLFFAVCVVVCVAGALAWSLADRRAAAIAAGFNRGKDLGGLVFDAPADGTLFPPDMAPPVFRWHAAGKAADAWLVRFRFSDGSERRASVTGTTAWHPSASLWRRVKAKGTERPVAVTVVGARGDRLNAPLCSATLSFQVSRDPVGAPIFFRDVNLPFGEAVKDPSKIRWRLGDVSSAEPPPVILENLPVCGNCHSFSSDGKVMGMDVDYANDKGSYVTTEVAPRIDLTPTKIITWSDYKRKDGHETFGLLSQVSPDASVRADPASAGAQCNLGLFLLERGRVEEALAHLTEALRIDPKKDNAYFAIGRIMVRQGRLADAVRCYSEALRYAPNEEQYLNALAWICATAPDPALRDGKRAVELASRLCQKSHFQSPLALDILAAGYAEAGRFTDAVRAAAQAVEGAQKQGNQRLAAAAAQRLDLYRRGQPFHQ